MLWEKENNKTFLANFCFCSAVGLKGLVCKLTVEHQIRYTKRGQTCWPSHKCSGRVGVFRSWWRCLSVLAQSKMWTSLSNKASKISFQNKARCSRRPVFVVSTVVNTRKFLDWRFFAILVCSRHHTLTNVFGCLRVSTLTGCPLRSNEDYGFPARWWFIFAYPPCTSRENWVRTTTPSKLAIEIFSISKTIISDDFHKLAFSLNTRFTDDVIFSCTDTLKGCPLNVNNTIKFWD